jgi:hypothetical protein
MRERREREKGLQANQYFFSHTETGNLPRFSLYDPKKNQITDQKCKHLKSFCGCHGTKKSM